ncbi:nuclear transport factor 2 family protein [Erythrobacter aurantius]|uniref:nuclear transport factor 2 family protein n=1 Tax=Erythrobacter aurantius TaxID=2909249 RepID=UPI00207A6FC7|nr:nuclear transport factor 2 family protein [Erythrobacter aurantius]
MSEADTLIERQVETYNAHDLEGFVACFAENAVLTDLASGRVFASGRDQIRKAYSATFARLPRAGVTITQRTAIGGVVVDVERIHADGSHAVAIYRVAEGAITHLWLVPPALVGAVAP